MSEPIIPELIDLQGVIATKLGEALVVPLIPFLQDAPVSKEHKLLFWAGFLAGIYGAMRADVGHEKAVALLESTANVGKLYESEGKCNAALTPEQLATDEANRMVGEFIRRSHAFDVEIDKDNKPN